MPKKPMAFSAASTSDRSASSIGRSRVDAYRSGGRRLCLPARSALPLVLVFLIMASCGPSRSQPPVREEYSLDQAPECLRPRTADICDRLLDEFREVNELAPLARATEVIKVGPSGDGRYILTATLVSKGGKSEFARASFTSTLCDLGWVRASSARGHDIWQGAGRLGGWLLDLLFTQERDDGYRIDVGLLTPAEQSMPPAPPPRRDPVACSTIRPG